MPSGDIEHAAGMAHAHSDGSNHAADGDDTDHCLIYHLYGGNHGVLYTPVTVAGSTFTAVRECGGFTIAAVDAEPQVDIPIRGPPVIS